MLNQFQWKSSEQSRQGNELATNGEHVLNDILAQSTKVADLVKDIATSSEDQVSKTEKISLLMSNIREASREQLTGIEQVNQSVTEIDSVTKNNAARAEEVSALAEDLTNQSRLLQKMVSHVSAYVGLGDVSQAQKVSSVPNTDSPATHYRALTPNSNNSTTNELLEF